MKHLDIDTDKITSMIDNHFVNSGTNTSIDVNDITSVSISKSILELKKFSDLKKQLTNELNNFFYDVMNYESEFKITTSWFTKSQNSQSSNYHNHNNSMFSGILYLQTDENSGDISFEDFNNRRYKLNVKEYNIYNCTEYQIKPIDGLLILFPSEVHHKILKNNSNIVRHSLAFNVIPVGEIGSDDSYLNIEVK
jgi:uncharacterized protein (TIGR02466 family)|tara:strand:- start:1265 stop:1846 length:582 start_codon:yes stop_codon:yes gene_type:complete